MDQLQRDQHVRPTHTGQQKNFSIFGSAQLSTLTCDLWGSTVRGICCDTSWYVYSFGLLQFIYQRAEKKQIAFLFWLLFLLLIARAFLLALVKRFSSAL